MKYLLTLFALTITMGASAQAPFTNFKTRVDTGVINKTAASSIYRGTIGGLYKALADSVAGRTDSVTKLATRYWVGSNHYTKPQVDSEVNAAVDSLNSAQLAVNALQQYWLEKRLQDTTYTVPDSVVISINGTRHAYRISITGGASFLAGTGLGLSGSTFYIDSSDVSTLKRLQDSLVALRAYFGSLNAGYQDSMLVNGAKTFTLQADGSVKNPVGIWYGKSTVTKLNLLNTSGGFQVWAGSSGMSLLQASTNGFSWSVGNTGNGDAFPGFYPQVFAFTPSAQGIIGGTATFNTASLCVGGDAVDRTSMLDLNNHDSTRGFRPPRMTASKRSGIVAPAPWLHGFQTDGNRGNYYYDSTTSAWVKILDAKDTVGMHGGGGGVTSVDGLTGAVSLVNNYIQASPSSAQTAFLHLYQTGFSLPALYTQSAYTGMSQLWTSDNGNAVEMFASTSGGVSGLVAGDACLFSVLGLNIGNLNAAGLRLYGTDATFSGANLTVVGHGIKATIPAYADDAAAATAGLATGQFWQTSSSNTLSLPTGVLMVKQ